MGKILVAYDCSAEAKKALEHAISIADATDEILILTVVPEPETVFCTDDLGVVTGEKVRTHLESLKEKHGQTGLKITTKIVRGDIVAEILRASGDPNIKIIVVGYKGVSKIGSFRLGSVSGEVAKLAKKPVLVVK
ncbi:universal stress protein [[Eubacterium] cellulosolvens]